MNIYSGNVRGIKERKKRVIEKAVISIKQLLWSGL